MPVWPEELHISLEECDAAGNEVVEVLARLSNVVIGRAAWKAAWRLRPHARIVLRDRARVIEDSARS